MAPSRFPQRITIDLATFHQDGLQQLAGLLPHQGPDELLKMVLSRGLVEMLKSEFGRIRGLDSSRVPFGMKRTLQEQHAMEAEHDKEGARCQRDLGLVEDVGPHAHRHLPQALSARLSEEMRQALEDFLDAHPDLDENDALSILVRRGLEHTAELEEVVQTAREKSASRMLSLAEELYARSKRRCR